MWPAHSRDLLRRERYMDEFQKAMDYKGPCLCISPNSILDIYHCIWLYLCFLIQLDLNIQVMLNLREAGRGMLWAVEVRPLESEENDQQQIHGRFSLVLS